MSMDRGRKLTRITLIVVIVLLTCLILMFVLAVKSINKPASKTITYFSDNDLQVLASQLPIPINEKINPVSLTVTVNFAFRESTSWSFTFTADKDYPIPDMFVKQQLYPNHTDTEPIAKYKSNEPSLGLYVYSTDNNGLYRYTIYSDRNNAAISEIAFKPVA